jgi:type I restriction enzyme M protein
MAKQKKEVKEKAIEVTLLDAANKLRGSVELGVLNFWL